MRYTNLLDFGFDKRQRYVKWMETKLEYLLDSVTTLRICWRFRNIEINFRKMGICIQKYTAYH